MVAITMGGEEKEQRVLVGVHLRADARQRAREIGDARDRKLLQRILAAGERDRAPRGAEALVEQASHEAHLLHEHVLAAVGREADEVELAHAGFARRHCGERALDELALQMKHPLLGERLGRLLLGRLDPHVGARKGEVADGDHRGHRQRAFEELRPAGTGANGDRAHRDEP